MKRFARILAAAAALLGAVLAAASAQAQDCSNPAAACAQPLPAHCVESLGAGAEAMPSRPEDITDETESAAEAAGCSTALAQYRGCLQAVMLLCGGAAGGSEPAPTPAAGATPEPAPAPSAPAFDPTGRSFRVGTVTLTNIAITPKPGSALLNGERVAVTFRHDVCCNAEVRIWVRADQRGSCRMAGAGSPLYKGTGTGDGYFVAREGSCEITGIRFQVKDERTGSENVLTLPATFTVQ